MFARNFDTNKKFHFKKILSRLQIVQFCVSSCDLSSLDGRNKKQ